MRPTVKFRSSDLFYWKEKSGLKPNTIRRKDEVDERFQILHECMVNGNYGFIEIEHLTTKKIFRRKIVDVSEYDGWVIISWRHSVINGGE